MKTTMKATLTMTMAMLWFPLVALAQTWDSSNFSAAGRKLQPVPTGHTPGSDNGAGDGTHNAGEDCGICHTPGGKAGTVIFTISGTVSEDRLGRRPAQGAEVILQTVGGTVLSMTTNVVGNFWSFAPIDSNPKAVASHGGSTELLYHTDAAGNLVPADPADARSWEYKAWIRNGDAVRQMVTLAPVGGATGPTSRMSCNMHHAPMGSSGALWVSPRATQKDAPAAAVSFRKHVQAILGSKCVPCHIPGAQLTRLATASDVDPASPTTVDFSSGHDFTSYDGSTYVRTATGQPPVTVTKPGFRDVVDPTNPDSSRALQKTRRGDPGAAPVHGGGGFWNLDDRDYQVLRQWIAEGALDN